MKDAQSLLQWPRPKEEVLLFTLLQLRGCKTRAEVEAVINCPYLSAWGYGEAIRELITTLPIVLANLAKIYGEEGEQ